MKAQYENKVISSTLLWIDHTVSNIGLGYTNHNSNFYEADTQWYGYHTYGAPYKQIVADHSVAPSAPTNPQIPTGLYVSGVLRNKGSQGLIDIDYNNGHAYFDHEIDAGQISGRYAVKDFNVYLTNKMDQELLFETKVNTKPKTTTTPSSIATNTITYPAIFLKNLGGKNEPWAFGGEDVTTTNVRAIVLADTQFNLDAACSILKDKTRTEIGLIEENNYPFNTLGGYKSSVYNYTGLVDSSTDHLWVKDVNVSQFNVDYIAEMKNANPDVFSAIIDFELENYRLPRA